MGQLFQCRQENGVCIPNNKNNKPKLFTALKVKDEEFKISRCTTGVFPMCSPFPVMDVSENSGTPKSSILIGFSIINHIFWGYPYFWKHPNSDHQDYHIFGSASLETFICHCSYWKGGQPNISHFHPGKFNMVIRNDGFKIVTPFKHSHFGYLYVYINFSDVCIPKIIGR